MSRVALVFPYFRTRAATELLFPPLGAATLAAQLRRLGIDTQGVRRHLRHLRAAQRRPGRLPPGHRRRLLHGQPDRHHAARRGDGQDEPAAGPARRRRALAHRVPGPLHAALRRRVPRRGRRELPAFCRDYFAARGPRRGSASCRSPTTAASSSPRPRPARGQRRPSTTAESELATFPLPDRSDFDHAAYQQEWLQKTGSKATSIIVTLGCPYGCDFCSKPIFGSAVRRRDLDAVFAEIAQIRGARLRQPVDRRRHLHAGPSPTSRSSAGASPARA